MYILSTFGTLFMKTFAFSTLVLGFKRAPLSSALSSTLVPALALLTGCATPRHAPPPPEPPRSAEVRSYPGLYRAAHGGAADASSPAPPGSPLGKRLADPEPLAEPWPVPAPGAPIAPPGRKVAHEGSITLRAPEPEAVIDSADALARALGGFSEERRKGWIRLRVPANTFDSAFSALLRLGEVVAHARRAEDVTDAFEDAELRRQVVGAAIARLETLLQRARGDAQKLRLIERLKAYREEWESLEARKRELQKRADYAALTLEAQGHSVAVAPGVAADFPEFRWIASLTPFSDYGKWGRPLRFEPPAGFAATKGSNAWHATSAEGTELTAWTLRPGLKGDARFWREAVRVRLAPQFKSADASDSLKAGDFLFTRFVSHGPRVHEYWVGVSGKGSCVRVVELYFPDTLQREKHSAAFLAAVKKGARRW